MDKREKIPQRTPEHVTGDKASDIFRVRRKPDWVVNPSESDYGWDFIVEIITNGGPKEDFYVQVKGTDSLVYTNNIISCSIEVRTINFLLGKSIPSMLCICDTSKPSGQETIYWVWLRETIKEIEQKNPEWKKQETITIHIPISQLLNSDNFDIIESYVRTFHNNLIVGAEISQILSSPFQRDHPIASPDYPENQKELVIKEVVQSLAMGGIVDVVSEKDGEKIESFSPEDQKRYRELKSVSDYLNTFSDDEAKKILDRLKEEIEKVSDGIKARYFNSQGVLSLHLNMTKDAEGFFHKAHELRTGEIKYTTNLLSIQYHFAGDQSKLPTSWDETLDRVLKQNPEHFPAIRLKAYRLGKTQGPKAAEKFLRSSIEWEKEPKESRGCLADIFRIGGDFEMALSILEEAEALNLLTDPLSWDLYGCICFLKAVGAKPGVDSILIIGPGPSSLDVTLLKKSCQYYEKAFQSFVKKGMPKLAEYTILNYSSVLTLLGEFKTCEHVCETYLQNYPHSVSILNALAYCFVFENQPKLSVQYAKEAFELEPSTAKYNNLLVSYFLSEEYGDVVELILKREEGGFASRHEEGASRSLLAISYNELGKNDLTQEQIKIMKQSVDWEVDSLVAQIEIGVRNHVKNDDIRDLFRESLKKHPDDNQLLTRFVSYLKPTDKNSAKEVVDHINRITNKRQLVPEEFSKLGNAYLVLEAPEKAEKVFDEAIHRYPNEYNFIYQKAQALVEKGDEEPAYQTLQEYLEKGKRNYSLLRNAAMLALNTGRAKEAIGLLYRALGKASDDKERGNIHCLLYEMKKVNGHTANDILRHVIEFGKTTGNDVAAEARFLMMGLLSPPIKETEKNSETDLWVKEIQTRLEKFSKEYPNYEGLMTFKIPEGITDEEKGTYLLSQITGIYFPWHLATEPVRTQSKVMPYPLSFRAQFFSPSDSIFDFWSKCTSSKDFAYAIHIWDFPNDLRVENENALQSKKVSIDLTALLTLAELDLLDTLIDSFQNIIIAHETRLVLNKPYLGFSKPHPLAEKIEAWRISNRSRILIRSIQPTKSNRQDERYTINENNIWVRREVPINQVITDGVGETLLLAQKYDTALYSDESAVRNWGVKDYKIKTFSTLSFIQKLRNMGKITIEIETVLFARMLDRNYRLIPFEPSHLMCSLRRMVPEFFRKNGKLPNSNDLGADPILGKFINEFGNAAFSFKLLCSMAVNWWVLILNDTDLADYEVLVDCMISPTFRLSLRSPNKELKAINANDQTSITALIWALFLWGSYRKAILHTQDSWSAIKSCCERLFPNDYGKFLKVLYEYIPKYLGKFIEEEKDLTEEKKTSFLVDLPRRFSNTEDTNKFESYFIKHRLKFMK